MTPDTAVYYVCDSCAHTWLAVAGSVDWCEACRADQIAWRTFDELDEAEAYSQDVLEGNPS